ncbi:ACT domain-containing protein [Phanerochaete sordida]|uniref:ACT domain-containing protein n=1 Tax=Phanerochaete sordida TaxID=48140 RepID=A0A9P3G7Q8_9APHY|nr:ACT domain-containing protein [Phanerochaete sordida]
MAPPPPSDHPAFRLRLLASPFAVSQLTPDEPVPAHLVRALADPAAAQGRFVSVTRTADELSVVRETDEADAAWRCIRIAGPMDFGITGVMANLTAPLKAAGVPVFAVSTWNTDYVLVPKDDAERAVRALTDDGWQFDA